MSPLGYEFIIPVPNPDLCCATCCNDSSTYPVYSIYPTANFGNWFGSTWSQFETFCAANPTTCQSGCLTPGDCYSGLDSEGNYIDPFYGDIP